MWWGRDGVGPSPTLVDDGGDFFGDIDAPFVGPAVVEPVRKLVAGVVIDDIYVELALAREAGEGQIAAAEKADGWAYGIVAEKQVELGVKAVVEIKFDLDLAGLDLRGEAAESGFIGIGGRAETLAGAGNVRRAIF